MSGFTEEDYNTLTGFINFVANKGQFNLNVTQSIELTKMLNKLQTVVLPKIEASILEVKSVQQLDQKKSKGAK
jgi:hypothetical protein